MDDNFLRSKLEKREDEGLLRRLQLRGNYADFFSNDYLGIVTNKLIQARDQEAEKYHGSTGSRLLSGNYALIENAERIIAGFHSAEAGLIFNSGYDANLGLLASVPGRGDTIVYDQLSHASIRDGVRLGPAQSFSFEHNDVEDLRKKLKSAEGKKFVVTESVFSMDGDYSPLRAIAKLCEDEHALLIVDEAHATGVVGERGAGLVQHLQLEKYCFARIHTFGKAVGTHGAIVLGSATLKTYLINFCRPFIYTTALPSSTIQATIDAYALFPDMVQQRSHINNLVSLFQREGKALRLTPSETPIQGVVIPGSGKVRQAAERVQAQGIDVRPIVYPTVPKGSERIRVVLHAFNSGDEVLRLVNALR